MSGDICGPYPDDSESSEDCLFLNVQGFGLSHNHPDRGQCFMMKLADGSVLALDVDTVKGMLASIARLSKLEPGWLGRESENEDFSSGAEVNATEVLITNCAAAKSLGGDDKGEWCLILTIRGETSGMETTLSVSMKDVAYLYAQMKLFKRDVPGFLTPEG